MAIIKIGAVLVVIGLVAIILYNYGASVVNPRSIIGKMAESLYNCTIADFAGIAMLVIGIITLLAGIAINWVSTSEEEIVAKTLIANYKYLEYELSSKECSTSVCIKDRVIDYNYSVIRRLSSSAIEKYGVVEIDYNKLNDVKHNHSEAAEEEEEISADSVEASSS